MLHPSSSLQLNRWSPLQVSRHLTLKNRIVVPPMASQTGDEHGLPTAATLAHYTRLAASGAGLVFVEYTYADPRGRSETNQLGLTSKQHGEALAKIAAAIRAQGAAAGLQLTHAGGKSESALAGGPLEAASAVIVPVKDRELERPEAMSLEAVSRWRESFVLAGQRAAAAGFQILELHAAHGYGLNQWLSPLTNQRTDAYGGSLAGRARLLLEIVGQLRATLPTMVLAVRLAGQDFLPGGLTLADAAAIARLLTRAGVDLIDVSSGLGGWRRPQGRDGEGYLVADAAALAAALTGTPVIGVGGIKSGAFIDQSLALGHLHLAAVGRAILANPEGFRREVLLQSQVPDAAAASLEKRA